MCSEAHLATENSYIARVKFKPENLHKLVAEIIVYREYQGIIKMVKGVNRYF